MGPACGCGGLRVWVQRNRGELCTLILDFNLERSSTVGLFCLRSRRIENLRSKRLVGNVSDLQTARSSLSGEISTINRPKLCTPVIVLELNCLVTRRIILYRNCTIQTKTFFLFESCTSPENILPSVTYSVVVGGRRHVSSTCSRGKGSLSLVRLSR